MNEDGEKGITGNESETIYECGFDVCAFFNGRRRVTDNDRS